MIVLHYLFIDSSSLYLLYFSAKERFYVFNDSKPCRQKTFCQRHFVLCGMASAYPFYHSCTFLQYRMDHPTHWLPPCLFHFVTGLPCPGCGGTRAFVSLLKGDLIHSFLYHPVVPFCFLLYVIFMVTQTMERILRRKTNLRFHALSFRLEYVYLALILILVQWIVKIIAALL